MSFLSLVGPAVLDLSWVCLILQGLEMFVTLGNRKIR